MLPPFPFMPPNARIGFSNIAAMYCAFFIGRGAALSLNALKSVFVLLTRGPVAGALSLCGGVLSILLIILLMAMFKKKLSYPFLSVCGAVTHNLGQLTAVILILSAPTMVYYLPVMVVTGAAAGLLTGALLRFMLPVFERFTPLGKPE